MSSNIIINSFPKFKECCDSLGITSIVDAANKGSRFVFAVNGFFPLSFDIETNDISIFQFKSKNQQTKQQDPLCIDISDDSKYVVTGYSDGSIALWSIEQNCTFIKSFQKLHQSPITQIRFGPNNNCIFASDTKGLTTIISILSISVAKIGMYTFKESIIYQGKLPIQNLVISRSNGPFPIGFIIFPTYYVCFDLKETLSSAFQSTKDIKYIVSETLYDPPSLALYPRSSDYFLTVSTGRSFKLLQVWSYDKMIPLINDFEVEENAGAICFSEFISSSLIVITTSNGHMELITTNNLKVCSSTSQQLKTMLNAIRSVLCHDEKVVLVTNESIYSLSFESWDSMILGFVRKGQFSLAFQSLSEISLDLNRNLVGIPSNLSVRRRRVIELGEKLLDEYFKDAFDSEKVDECSEKVASIAMYTTTLEITEYLATRVASLYEEHGRLGEFFEGIQRGTGKSFALFITPQFLGKFLEFARKNGKLDAAEDSLLELEYQEGSVGKVIEVAGRFGLLRLLRHLFLVYFDDAIAPCEFYYESGRLAEYFEGFFAQNEKDGGCEVMDDATIMGIQRSLVVWLMLPDGEKGSLARLRALFEGDWKRASSFTRRIIAMLPIQFTFADTIRVENFIEKVLEIAEDADYESCEPVLDQVLPILPAKEIPLTGKSVRHIVRWCFTSHHIQPIKRVRTSSMKNHNVLAENDEASERIPSPSVRESVFEMVSNAFPGVVPKRYLIPWCERAGFTRIIQNYYLPKREYGRIIASMLLNDEARLQVFDFIENSIKRPNNASKSRDLKSGVDKEKMKVALLQNSAPLLLLDPDRFVMLIESHYQDLHNDLIESLAHRPHRLVYLNSLVDVVGQQGLTTQWANMIFQLSLDYDPDHAYHFLTEHINDVDLDEVERLSEKYGRVDCLVQVKIYNQQFREAIVQIGQEIERTLLDFIESDGELEVSPKSVDELCDIVSDSSSLSCRRLKVPMDMIRVAIRLLQSRSIDKDIALQWQRMYLYFQFPMYHSAVRCGEDKKRENVKNCVSLMFAFFIVSSLDSITAHHALCILCLHFSVLEIAQYNSVYANMFSRINYQKNLLRSLDEMLMIDTMQLVDNVYRKRSKGIKSQLYMQCCTCQELLSRSSDPFNIFPCGHCYHLRCNTANKCPLCAGSFVQQPPNVQLDEVPKKMTTRQVQFLVRRLNFALRKNFGEDAQGEQSANAVFFGAAHQAGEEGEKKMFALNQMIPPTKEITIKLDDDDEEDDDDYGY